MAVFQTIQDLNIVGTTAQTINIVTTDYTAAQYYLRTDTASPLVADKTIAFTGTPPENCFIEIINTGGVTAGGGNDLKINGVTLSVNLALVGFTMRWWYKTSAWYYEIYGDLNTECIETGNIVDEAVTKEKVNADVAGDGLVKNSASDPIDINLEAVNPTLKIATNELGVKLDAAGGIVTGASGIKVKLEASNPSLEISTNELGIKFDPSGQLESSASGVKLQDAPCVCIKEVTVSIASAEILQLNTTNQIVLSVPSGYVCQFVGTPIIKVIFVTDAYATNTNVQITGSLAADVFWESDCLASVYTGYYLFRPVAQSSTNVPEMTSGNDVFIRVETGDPTAGSGTIEITFMYRLLPY